jgi:nucleotide-binding universal stress UspA family protein
MFQHILVPLDGSPRAEHALPIAARLAHASGGCITVLRAVPLPGAFAWQTRKSIRRQETLDADRVQAADYLNRLAASEELAGVKMITEVCHGQPAQLILAAAGSHSLDTPPVDLIVMCSHGYMGFKRWMLGSVAQKIIRHSPVPVLVLRDGGIVPSCPYPDPTRPLHAVAATIALDGSSLAEAALLPTAYLVAALAAPAQGSLHLTRVVQRPGIGAVLNGRERLDPLQREQALEEAINYLCKTADTLRASLAGDLHLAVTWSVAANADVADALIKVAEMGRVDAGTSVFGGCDILALTTHGRGGLQRWALGSVTERILGATRLPMLVVDHKGGKTNGREKEKNSPTVATRVT